jgi:DNA-binding transcriptional LysR family regulator
MKISSLQLEAFYAVAQARNFTVAAQTLHVTQSALSQRISNLEAHVQTTLFIRDRAGIRLTEAADELLRYCRLQADFEGEFLGKYSSTQGDLAGVVRIAGVSSVMRSLALPGLVDLAAEHPQVQLQTFTREIRELLPMLKNSEADFILTSKASGRDEVESLHLGDERNVLVRTTKKKSSDTFLDHDEADETTYQYLKLQRKSSANVRRHFLDDIYGVIEGVQLGLGQAVVPEHLVSAAKGITIIEGKALEIPVYLQYFKQPFYSKLHQSVVQVLSNSIGNNL